MAEILLRFSHLGEEIFDSLDNKNLVICRKVCRTWKSFIVDHKFFWVRVINKHEENMCILGKREDWRKDLNVFHLACLHSKTKVVKMENPST